MESAEQGIDSRAEIEEFVEQMYRDIAMDELLHSHFETIAQVHWQAHMATW